MKRFLVPRLLLLLLAILTPASFTAAAPAAPPRAASQAVAPKSEIQEIRLENGLRLFVLERTASPTFAGYYQFGVGAASDPKGRTGIAHLLEHMMFKGTTSVGTLDARAEAPLLKRLSELWRRLDKEMDRSEDPFQKADPETIASLKREIESVTAEEKKLIVKNEFDELMTRAGGVSENASTGTRMICHPNRRDKADPPDRAHRRCRDRRREFENPSSRRDLFASGSFRPGRR